MPRALAIFGVPAVLCAAWTVVAGKDLNWDLLHYHYYIAHSLVEGRSAQDYFAARTETFLNPLGYVPFYLMVSAGWHAVVVSMVLAAVHGTAIGLLYLLSKRVLAHRPPGVRVALGVLGAAAGATTAVFWATAGTSFLDPLLVVPMVGGTVLLLGARPHDAVVRAVGAGALFGVAAALKYSNAFFALAALVLVVSIAATPRRRIAALAAYAAGGATSVAVLAGPWLARLGREFGNPFFPHLNGLFGSAEAPPVMLAAGRFAPQDVGAAILFPFRITSPEVMVYAEISAPDLRFAILAIAGAAVLGFTWMGKSTLAESGRDGLRLLAFLAVCLTAWIATSGNARYGLLVLLLVGPCLAWVADRLAPRYAPIALAVMVVVQAGACIAASPTRWFLAEPWTTSWLGFKRGGPGAQHPALYLTLEPQAMTAAIPFMHAASSFANLQGQAASAARLHRLHALRDRNGGRVRVLGRGLRLHADGRPRPEAIEVYDWTLARFGFRVDPADCFAIDWHDERGDALSRWANAVAPRQSRSYLLSLASCAVAPFTRDPREVEEEARMASLFDRIESACPSLFRGLTAVTERFGSEWSRAYPALEARMETQAGRVMLVPWFELRYVYLGTLQDWRAPQPRVPAVCAGGA